MDPATFDIALGDCRVLSESLTDVRSRVFAHDGDVVVGAGVIEPLFGRQAEGVIAVAESPSGSIVSFLLDGLLELAASRGIILLRFRFDGPGQRALAHRLMTGRTACHLRSDRLEIRTALSDALATDRSAAISR